MKIIILGSNGMLGNYVSSYFNNYYEVIKMDRSIIDAFEVNYQDIYNILAKYKSDVPVVVINCIGIIPQRNDLNEYKKFIKINTMFPNNLALCCEHLNYKLFHISTDCVFSGSKGKYVETDTHDEYNIYGVSKSLGEPKNCCVIRTSIIGEELYNKKSLLEWVKSQKNNTINGYVNHYWNGITCLQLAKIIKYMLHNDIYWYGVRHIYSPDIVSKYQLVKYISEIYNLNITVNKKEHNFVDKTLSSNYPIFIDIPTIYDQIVQLYNYNLE
uniref:dTDP-4-dehydrorhamnose reductase n=1 Tax=Borely moumouvirus TaxID=2712067 RepID=A0A6G6ABE4_9VIRU